MQVGYCRILETTNFVSVAYKDNCPESIGQLMQDCWQLDASARPGFGSIHARISATLPQVAKPSATTANTDTATDYNTDKYAGYSHTYADTKFSGFYDGNADNAYNFSS